MSDGSSGGRRCHVLRCRHGELVLGQRTLLMGVINVTPDSFSDGGVCIDPARAVAHGLHMAEEGADIIDIGGESTRPGSYAVSREEELDRIIPVIRELSRQVSIPLSVDTYKADVAEGALDAGAQIVNDISGLQFDPRMVHVTVSFDCPVVIMHIQGSPRTMQVDPHYEDVIGDIVAYLREGLQKHRDAGGDSRQVIIDPGIGFGKTVQHNVEILERLDELAILDCPILVGTSRKSFIGKVLGREVHDREVGTLATIAVCIMKGAHIVRTHEVGTARQVADMVDAIMSRQVLRQ